MKFDPQKDIKRIIMIVIASFIMALNIKTFVQTGGLYPGGATGLTILIQGIGIQYFHIELPYTLVNLLLNAFPVYIGFKFIGKKFTLFSLLTIVLTSTLTDIMPHYPITHDTLLISIFGGIINGTAISLVLSVDATTGGTDFIGIYLSQKKGVDSWNMVLAINAFIIGVAGLLFGWDKALYSIIYQYASTQMLHMLYQKFQKTTLFIVTNKPHLVCQMIKEITNHGATIMDGEGSYEHQERSVVYSVISRGETEKVIHTIRQVDKKAFINTLRTDQVAGRFYQAPTD